ncbi:MAG TPA: MFS transporter [Afifellaceae bacterium]|nr:MFS transporter [Afifellaceae bacterium]
MLAPFANATYRHLFAAQVVALLGTGLATVALGLLAYELAGERAGAVLGTALAIKMIAYVGVAPVASAFAGRLPRRAMLVTLDAVRAAIALCLPFVDQVWQVYLLIFLLQSASAAFTPAFQAAIPDILPEERDYTKALSLSRLAYDLESLLSPALAAVLLTLVSFHALFAGTALGFAISALLVVSSTVPSAAPDSGRRGIWERTVRGMRVYLATPRLRGLFALNLAAAAAGAMVIVNTVVLVKGLLGRGDADVGLALAFFGGGSMLAALALPRLLDGRPDRSVMQAGALAMFTGLAAIAAASHGSAPDWYALLAIWLLLGVGYSAVLTPSGRLLRRSAHAADRPSLFAAQFALSHACWLVTYPLAGWLGAEAPMAWAAAAMGLLAACGALAAALLWPAQDPDAIAHVHDNLPENHPHLHDATRHADGFHHRHAFVIDDEHLRWPTTG